MLTQCAEARGIDLARGGGGAGPTCTGVDPARSEAPMQRTGASTQYAVARGVDAGRGADAGPGGVQLEA